MHQLQGLSSMRLCMLQALLQNLQGSGWHASSRLAVQAEVLMLRRQLLLNIVQHEATGSGQCLCVLQNMLQEVVCW